MATLRTAFTGVVTSAATTMYIRIPTGSPVVGYDYVRAYCVESDGIVVDGWNFGNFYGRTFALRTSSMVFTVSILLIHLVTSATAAIGLIHIPTDGALRIHVILLSGGLA